jgi:hypothetical protein
MSLFKLFFITTLTFSSLQMYSQHSNKQLYDALIKKEIEFKKEINFKKAHYFFIKKNWDSTLVYSMKQLNSSTNKELAEYCHFLRGYSFIEIKLFKEGISELNLISNEFSFYPLVNKNLGDDPIARICNPCPHSHKPQMTQKKLGQF